jgi:hypothetical protein
MPWFLGFTSSYNVHRVTLKSRESKGSIPDLYVLVTPLAPCAITHENPTQSHKPICESAFLRSPAFRKDHQVSPQRDLASVFPKRADIHEALLSLCCALICWQIVAKHVNDRLSECPFSSL